MKTTRSLLLSFLIFGAIGVLTHAQDAENLLREAKLDMFDEDWGAALDKVRRIRDDFPESPIRSQAFFYEAKILEGLDRYEDALVMYESYLSQTSSRSPLVDDATFAVVGLGVDLYQRGKTVYIDRTLEALEAENKDLRFFAALQLSYINDSNINRRAVPVLNKVKNNTRDREERNQATLALLRIDPDLLGPAQEDEKQASGTHLQLLIIENNEEVFKISLPLSLARLLFSALPEEARLRLVEKGINPNNLLDQLEKGEDIIEVRSESEIIRLSIR